MSLFYVDIDTQYSDRYDLAKFLEFTEDGGYNTLNSVFLQEILKLSPAGYLESYGERPEALSYKIYDDTQFYWIIMYYNGVTDFSKDTGFSLGDTIRYPSISDLEKIMFMLKAKERAN